MDFSSQFDFILEISFLFFNCFSLKNNISKHFNKYKYKKKFNYAHARHFLIEDF
jgi:hypothetical protein